MSEERLVSFKTFEKKMEDGYIVAYGEMLENRKSNWIPNSKGGEPNCRRR